MPAVKTLHHPHEPALTELYRRHPQITYVAISMDQRRREPLPAALRLDRTAQPLRPGRQGRRPGGRDAAPRCGGTRRGGLGLVTGDVTNDLTFRVERNYVAYWDTALLAGVNVDRSTTP